MLAQLAVGLLLICVTTIVQAGFMFASIRFVQWRLAKRDSVRTHFPKVLLVSAFTALMFVGVVLQAFIWALFYLYQPSITTLPNLETALYFSLVTFTSLGYGDVVLTESWRLLAALEGATGVIVLGWTTALIFYTIQIVYQPKRSQ